MILNILQDIFAPLFRIIKSKLFNQGAEDYLSDI